MTIDQDRGAYAPHMDAPLAFDARRPTDRRPLPMTLIASAGVLALIVGALAMAYRGGVRGADQPRLVGEPVGAIKTAAAPEAASDTATADSKLDVYSPQNVPAQAPASPNFAPEPEQPKPRPVIVAPPPAAAAAPAASAGLQVRTVDPVKVRIGEPETTAAPVRTAADRLAAASARTAVTPGAADRPAPPAPKPLATAQAAAPAVVKVAAEPPRAVDGETVKTFRTAHADAAASTVPKAAKVKPAAEAEAKPAAAAKAVKTARADPGDASVAVKTAKAAAPATTAASAKTEAKAASGPAAVQVGAFSSAELAQKGFADAGKLAPLGGHAKSVEKVSRDGKTFYRATLGGFADKAAAKAFCAKLSAAGGRCLVKS